MPSSTIRRQMKNMVNNYSDAEKKVREATSNDPWGPSSSLMSEIADLTYNVVAFSEIMSMIWKRLNDHGKNWRHVYKALTLLDYLIKTGSERVALQCKENIFAIQTLKDFQYIDRDGKDQGINVREKSKQLVVLLKDEDRLKGERSQALKTKERMAQVSTGSSQMGFGRGSSQPNLSTSYSEEYGRSEGSPASYHGCSFDLFNSSNGTSKEDFSEFDSLRSSSSVPTGDGGVTSSIPSQASLASSSSLDLFDPLPTSSLNMNLIRKTPESFLGPNAALVNLDSLVTKPAQPPPVVNPFLASTGVSAPPAAAAAHANPFQVSQPAPPTLNQMRVSPMPSGFAAMPEPMALSSMPAQSITMVPMAGMAPMGHVMPGMGEENDRKQLR
ncbi:hypothetical protein F2P81_014813 [Scophthalmus maximus]|uniref:ENTH domain-containing protein n=1 Tax=Scophthalmus maximus TaxID=52904 RepID=A0A6A4SED3_SCOMX|nr:hypothetical protein F2P81_014813 [Scophthalmus maximus]